MQAPRGKFATTVLVGAFALLSLGALAPALASADGLPSGFRQETLIGGLDTPTAMEIGPDGRVYVAEKSGLVKAYDGFDDDSPSVVADLRQQVHNYWDRGLLDIALDPQFTTHPFLYALYSSETNPDGTARATPDACPGSGDADPNCAILSRLTRMEIDPDTGQAGPEQVLVQDWCQQFLSHSTGSIAFDASGALYAGGGDGASYIEADWGQFGTPANPCGDPPGGVGGHQILPTSEGGTLRSQDLRTGGDPTGLSGSIIRVDRETGDPLPDNPNPNGRDANAKRIVAYGFRNPFRFAFRPGTDDLWIGDVGWAEWEELNRLDLDTQTTPANYGWPCYEGDAPQSSYGQVGLNICSDLYDDVGTAIGPQYTYNHGAPVKPGDGCQDESTPTTYGSSISGVGFYEGSVFPPALRDGIFFSDYSRGCIWSVPFGLDGSPDPGVNGANITSFDVNAGPVSLLSGPDDSLLYVDIGNYEQADSGRIVALRYLEGGNQPPVAALTANPSAGKRTTPNPSDPSNPAKYTLNVQFDGSGSTDADLGPGQHLAYAWDLDGDGAFDDSTAQSPLWQYAVDGVYVVRLRVTDPEGDSNTARLAVQVGNTPPTVSIDSVKVNGTPVNLDAHDPSWKVGDQISYAGTISDDGAVDPYPLYGARWTLIVRHCTGVDGGDCHSHPVDDWKFTETGSFAAPEHEYPSHLILRFTGTDAGGLSATDTVRIDPKSVAIDVDSDPSGVDVVINNRPQTTPAAARSIMGAGNSLIAPAEAMRDGVAQPFERWERNGVEIPGAGRALSLKVGSDSHFTAVYAGDAEPPPPPPPGDPYRFVGVTPLADLEVDVGETVETVRMVGLRSGKRGSCGTRGARKELHRFLKRGAELALDPVEGFAGRDGQGRLIRTVEWERGNVAYRLVRKGWARTAKVRFPGRKRFAKAERKAQRKRVGAWGRCRRR
jgi:glucose/arabinose dehydrogenase